MVDANIGSLKVMIVDDDAFALKVLTRVLEGIGIRDIVTAEGGAAALEKLSSLGEDALDLIISDIEMPDMDGYELSRRIRYGIVPQHKNIALVILTGHYTDENVLHARTHKIDCLVAKPPSVDVLKLEIEEALKRAAARGS